MTTSPSIVEPGGARAVPGGAREPSPVSVEDLARLANAFFSEVPGVGPPAGAARGLATQAPATLAPTAQLSSPVAPALSSALPPHEGAALSGAGAPSSPALAEQPPAPAPARSIAGRGVGAPGFSAPQPPPVSAPSSARGWAAPQPESEPGFYREALAQRSAYGERGGGPAAIPLDSFEPGWDERPAPRAGQTGAPGHATAPAYDVHGAKADFPILRERVNGKPLVWLDNGATTQKPQCVIDRLQRFYAHENSNVHRAAHTLAARATDAYEAARKTAARFIGAASHEEVVFVRGTTEGINLVAQSWGRANIGQGDEILVSHLEHHANIVPWQLLAAEKGARLKVIPVDDTGQIRLDEAARLLDGPVKLVAITQVSNALGTTVPVQAVIALAHAKGIPVLVDGAQSVAHMPTNVTAIDADFFVFSGHKIYAPTGIGVVWAKKAIWEQTPPWQGGGNMIADVTFERTQFQPPPSKFEAGTGNLADAVGLAAALDYVERIGVAAIGAHEHALLEDATARLETIPGLRLFGSAPGKAGVLSFTLEGHDPVAVGRALDAHGIAVRAGHHCAQPILRRFGVEATVRATFGLYNTFEDVAALERALRTVAGRRGP